MASEETARFLASWMEMPADFFETLTFGELEVGQRFISLPQPGDNSGHGGFRGAHGILTKTDQRAPQEAPDLPYGIPTGRAVGSRGVPSSCPDSMPVILVE
jgi:hypothetical protein